MTTSSQFPAVHAPKILGPEPRIHPEARVSQSSLGAYCDIGAMTSIVESTVGDYTYLVDQCSVLDDREVLLDRLAHAHQPRQPPDVAGDAAPHDLPARGVRVRRG